MSIRTEDSGNLNLLINKYFMHLASLMHPLSSRLVFLYDTPHITARFCPWADGGAPARMWLYGDGDAAGGADGATAGGGGGAWWWWRWWK